MSLAIMQIYIWALLLLSLVQALNVPRQARFTSPSTSSFGDVEGNFAAASGTKTFQFKKSLRALIPRKTSQRFCLDKTSQYNNDHRSNALGLGYIVDNFVVLKYISYALDLFSYYQLHVVPLNSEHSFEWYSISLNSSDNSNRFLSHYFGNNPNSKTFDNLLFSYPSPLHSSDQQACNIDISPLASEVCVTISAGSNSDLSLIMLTKKYFRSRTLGGVVFAGLGIFFPRYLLDLRLLQYIVGMSVFIVFGPFLTLAAVVCSYFGELKVLGFNAKSSILYIFLAVYIGYVSLIVFTYLEPLSFLYLNSTPFQNEHLTLLDKFILYLTSMSCFGAITVHSIRSKNANNAFQSFYNTISRRWVHISSYIVLFHSFASFTVAATVLLIVFALEITLSNMFSLKIKKE